jgi:hypothetical protein
MENSPLKLRKVIFWVLPFSVFPLIASAYEPSTTHAALTQEIIRLFNASGNKQYSIADTDEHIVTQGSIDEDAGARPLHHFYDPVRHQGLTSGISFSSAPQWAGDTMGQTGIVDSVFAGTFKSYFSGDKDYSWERGVYE